MPLLAMLALILTAPAPGTPQCALNVAFGSYAAGIDRPAFDKVQASLKRDARVRSVSLQRWGREGETTLCIDLRRDRDVRAVFGRVKALLPARPKGPITVEARGGLRFEAPRRR